MVLVSAAPFIALLDEPDYDLKAYALQSLDEHVDQLWAEIADHITQMYGRTLLSFSFDQC